MKKLDDLEEVSDLRYNSSPMDHDASSTHSCSSFAYGRTNSETSIFSENLTDDFNSCSSEANSPMSTRSTYRPTLSRFGGMKHNHKDNKVNDSKPTDLELEMMKERLSKLLLGEDMSGSGKGVSTAVTVSNAITNLYVSMFGQHQRLEPLYQNKKMMWKREMTCLLSVCDYIIEFAWPSEKSENEGSMKMMISRPRSDIDINIPALIKLDALLIEILDSFQETEFWYNKAGSMSSNSRSESFRQTSLPHRNEDKWWLPVPCVSMDGLSEMAKKHLKQKRDAANQIHKAAMAINANVLSDMEVPHTYIASLPKKGRTTIGDTIYRYMNSSASIFCPDHLLDSLNLSSEHEALELADRVEASMYIWRQKACSKYPNSSWDLVNENMDDDKNVVLAQRAKMLLFTLKQRFPELAQTTLDTSKIQYNRDVGQAILESYSRVMEGLAFNIVGWIEDVLFVDKSMANKQEEC
ncbi:rop guanine nucleotide exchange factor 2-like [Rutidosis leptorrhynchoides]|uniref:rop guanine nucleotide exchange factor 2-like n=1 Tax=Rutidosis leptorrhynchoides TaxID=125765 RepID=UPI003A9940B5